MSTKDQGPPNPGTPEEVRERYKQRQEAERKAHEESREQFEKTNARRAWLADGGDEKSFERAWPGIRDQLRRERVAERQEAGRIRRANQYKSVF
jgi:hypothetical protein